MAQEQRALKESLLQQKRLHQSVVEEARLRLQRYVLHPFLPFSTDVLVCVVS